MGAFTNDGGPATNWDDVPAGNHEVEFKKEDEPAKKEDDKKEDDKKEDDKGEEEPAKKEEPEPAKAPEKEEEPAKKEPEKQQSVAEPPKKDVKVEEPKKGEEEAEKFATDVPDVFADAITRIGINEFPVFKVSATEFYQNMKNGRKRIRFNTGSPTQRYMAGTRYSRPFYIQYTNSKKETYTRKIK